MGREIRRVPPNWEHPKNERYRDERYQPQYDENYEEAVARWITDFKEWLLANPSGFSVEGDTYWECEACPPEKDYYRKYKDSEATWYQIYETVSEGTPVTPPFETEDELIDYLVEHGDFWDQQRLKEDHSHMVQKYTRETATKFVKGDQWAPSMIFNAGTGQLLMGINCSLNEVEIK